MGRVLIVLLSVLLSASSLSAAGRYIEASPVSLEVDESLYDEEDVFFLSSGRTVYGTLVLPADTSYPVPAIVMLHSTGSDRDETGDSYVYTARVLAAYGIASLRIDLPGSGESKVSYRLYNYETALEDTVAAKEYLQSLDEVDSDRIGILGWSQGGTNAIIAAAEDPDFQSVVLWGGLLDPSSMVSDELYEEARVRGFAVTTFRGPRRYEIGLQWFEDAYGKDVLSYVGLIQAPVLAINGENDTVVPPGDGTLVMEYSPNDNSRQCIIYGASHTFNISSDPSLSALSEAVGTTVDWFGETL